MTFRSLGFLFRSPATHPFKGLIECQMLSILTILSESLTSLIPEFFMRFFAIQELFHSPLHDPVRGALTALSDVPYTLPSFVTQFQ
jgi:hypothetical protein